MSNSIITQIPQIRTVEQLRTFMQYVEDTYCNGKTIEDSELCWFVCMRVADALLDSCSTKDIAALFSDGVQAINTLEAVQAYIDTYLEDCSVEHEEVQNVYLVAAVYRFFGLHHQADLVVDGNHR